MPFSPCGLGSFQRWPSSLLLKCWPLGPQTRRTRFIIQPLLTNVVRRHKLGQHRCPSHEPQLGIAGVQPRWLLLCWQVGSLHFQDLPVRMPRFCQGVLTPAGPVEVRHAWKMPLKRKRFIPAAIPRPKFMLLRRSWSRDFVVGSSPSCSSLLWHSAPFQGGNGCVRVAPLMCWQGTFKYLLEEESIFVLGKMNRVLGCGEGAVPGARTAQQTPLRCLSTQSCLHLPVLVGDDAKLACMVLA